MGVFKRGKVCAYEFTFLGERVRKSTRQPSKNTARQMEAVHRAALFKGEIGIRDKTRIPTFRQFAPRFREAIETQCQDKPATITFYLARLRSLLAYEPLAILALDQVDEPAVDAYTRHRMCSVSRRGQRLAPATINRELTTLRRALGLAQEWKVIDRVPRIRLLRGERSRELVPSDEQESLYLGAASRELEDIATMLLDSGLRVGEALSLD